MLTVQINKLDTLTLNKGDFSGDITKAKQAIEEFARKNQLDFEAEDHGCTILTINGEDYPIDRNGIDISMMLDYCGIDESLLKHKNMPLSDDQIEEVDLNLSSYGM